MKKDHREINLDGLEIFISILEGLDFTYFRSILCLDMPIMTCPSRGGSKPLHPFAFILASIIRTTITKKVVEEEGPRGSPNWRTLVSVIIKKISRGRKRERKVKRGEQNVLSL